tara:strand:- start:1057 stop:1416 length:360 start_codon:yes stop_codon:yes gene_type:complete
MRSAKKEIKKMPLKPIKKVKPSKDMSYSHSNQPSKALSTPAGSTSSKNKSKDKSKDKDTSKKGSKILGEAVGEAGAALGQAISNLGTSGAPPENYVSKVFARRSGFKMKYNKNNFPFKN